MRRDRRRPSAREVPPGRGPRQGADPNTPDHIIFRFNLIDGDGPFGWRTAQGEHLWSHVKQRIASVETMTWQELMQGGDNHTLSASSLSREASRRLGELGQEDASDTLFSMRVTGRMRIIGIRDRRYFRILWWDPAHGVSPSHR